MTTAADIIDRARIHIRQPRRWTKGYLFRNARGDVCGPLRADRLCILGAVVKACMDLGRRGFDDFGAGDLLDAEAKARGFACSAAFNDSRFTTHADVMDLLGAAYMKAIA